MISDGLGSPPAVKHPQSTNIARVNSSSSKSTFVSATKPPLLPDLSASTQEILARLRAESTGDSTNQTSDLANQPGASTTMSTPENVSALDSTVNDSTQFQRPTMAPEIFDKSKLKSAFASALIPKSKTLPSQPVKDSSNHLSAVAAVSSNQKSTSRPDKPSRQSMGTSTVGPASMKSDESTIEVMPSPSKTTSAVANTFTDVAQSTKLNAEKTETPKPKTRMNHTYVLPSGEIVNSGKGLGRGRPGIKRGPRKPKSVPNLTETAPVSRKRKRSSVDSERESGGRSRSLSYSASDSGDEYSPQATQTRSGRQIQRPPTFVLPESPSSNKRPPHSGPVNTTATAKLPIKRKVYRGKEQSALCEHCLRGYGPLKNAIVFCDGCNRCWHQKCHDPFIPRKLVLDPNTEWFCNECSAIREKAKKAKKATLAQKAANVNTKAEKLTISAPLPPSAEQTRQDYFTSLPKEKLTDLLMQASALAPNLPLWQVPTAPSQPQPPASHSHQPTTNNVTSTPTPAAPPALSTKETLPASYPTPNHDLSDLDPEAQDDVQQQLDLDDSEDNNDDDGEFLDEHARLYPKPGNGVQLPPESEDLAMLLEEGNGAGNGGTFSHELRSTREGLVDAGGMGKH